MRFALSIADAAGVWQFSLSTADVAAGVGRFALTIADATAGGETLGGQAFRFEYCCCWRRYVGRAGDFH